MCEAPSMMPNQIEMMRSYKDLANNWVNQFDHMMNTAQNSNFPIGLKCLADKQAALNQQLQNTENSLTALQTQLKKDLQVFKENNKKIGNKIYVLYHYDYLAIKKGYKDYNEFFNEFLMKKLEETEQEYKIEYKKENQWIDNICKFLLCISVVLFVTGIIINREK